MTLSGYEALFFWIFGLAAIFAGLLTVMARNAVHSALFLISSLVSVAALFVLARAEFIAGVQILVYVGGVMVLFLFVIMLVNVGAEERGRDEIFNNQRQVTASLIFCLLLVGGMLYCSEPGPSRLAGNPSHDSRSRGCTTSDARTSITHISNRQQQNDGRFRRVSGPFFIAMRRCRLKSRACCCWWRLSDP